MAMETCCPIVELRQYTLKPQGRETLIRVFDEHFIEGQERTGMRIIGQFRDRSDANRFVWLRGFSDMEARRQALSDFYSGPVWTEHGPEANETMIDSDDVLLLKPVGGRGFALDLGLRPSGAEKDSSADVVVATIYPMKEAVSSSQMESAASAIEAAFAEAGATLVAVLVTEHAVNTFPRLPIREDANVLVSISSYPNEVEYRRSLDRLRSSPMWKERVARELEAIGGALPPETLLLQPTGRSLLRHR
jgi:NIPSNAP